MNKNLIIGLLIVVALIAGGYAMYAATKSPSAPSGETATTTTTTSTNTTPPVVHTVTPGVPVVVTNSTVYPSNATAVVTGSVAPSGASTSYWYEYGKTESLGTRTTSQAIGSGWAHIPAPAYITGLSGNTKYFFRLSAQNSLGTVVGATYSFMTNNTPPAPGVAPSARTENATDVERTAATLNGQVNPNSFATTIWFEYGDSTNFGNATALQGAGQGSSLTSVFADVSDLKPLTKYYFRVNAQNQYGTVNGTTKSFTTSGPAAPKQPSVSASSASSIATSSAVFNGKVNPNGAETTYWFEYGTDSLLGNILGSTTHTDLAGSGTVSMNVSTPVKNLNRNTRYYYRLVAENGEGTTRSEVENFRTKP